MIKDINIINYDNEKSIAKTQDEKLKSINEELKKSLVKLKEVSEELQFTLTAYCNKFGHNYAYQVIDYTWTYKFLRKEEKNKKVICKTCTTCGFTVNDKVTDARLIPEEAYNFSLDENHRTVKNILEDFNFYTFYVDYLNMLKNTLQESYGTEITIIAEDFQDYYYKRLEEELEKNKDLELKLARKEPVLHKIHLEPFQRIEGTVSSYNRFLQGKTTKI